MNISEFKRRLGAEPRSRDPEVLRARASAPEFERAAVDAEHFEQKLERALHLPVPDAPIGQLASISAYRPRPRRPWQPIALAAGLLIAVGAGALVWRSKTHWDSVEAYVVQHYRHDGNVLLARAQDGIVPGVEELFAQFQAQAAPQLADMVTVIKICRSPNGKGVHMVLSGPAGLVTVIFMPKTRVIDHEMLAFDGLEAMLVQLPRGSAVIVGKSTQNISGLYALVRDSIQPLGSAGFSNDT